MDAAEDLQDLLLYDEARSYTAPLPAPAANTTIGLAATPDGAMALIHYALLVASRVI